MSDVSSKSHQINEDNPQNLADTFFNKLKKDGPKLDKVGEVYVRHLSGQVHNQVPPPSFKDDELDSQSNLLYEEEDKPSGARMLNQLKSEIRKEFSDQKKLDSNLNSQSSGSSSIG